jgi:hypothetical protein
MKNGKVVKRIDRDGKGAYVMGGEFVSLVVALASGGEHQYHSYFELNT